MVMNEEGRQKYDDYYYYSKAERDRSRVIAIVAKSRKPVFVFEIKELLEKVWFYESQLLGNESELEKECKSISRESIQHWCSQLTEEGILERDKEHEAYSISDKAAKELRHFPSIFATEALHHLLTSNNFPANSTSITADTSMVKFVNAIGALVVYAFIEGIRPFEDTTTGAYAKDKTAVLQWIRNAIPIEEIFNQFLTAFASDKEVRNKKEEEKKKEDNDIRRTEPSLLDRLDREKVSSSELSQALQKAYPDIYKSLEIAKAYSLARPKMPSATGITDEEFSRLKERFCRYLCQYFHDSDTRTFVPHKIFSVSKMPDYIANEPALKPYIAGGDSYELYRCINRICRDLVLDRMLDFTENPDNKVREYCATTNLIRIYNRLHQE